MALVTYNLKDKRYGYAQQAAWATAVADAGAFDEVECEPFTIDPDIKYRVVEGSHATRDMTYGDISADTKGSMPFFTVAGEVKANEIDNFLYAHFQKVVEGDTPFGKTFTYHATQPDLSVLTAITEPGYVATWCERNPASSTSLKVGKAISKSITLTLTPAERLKYTQDWVSLGTADLTSDPSGTWTRQADEYFHFEDVARATIDFGGGAQPVVPTGDWVFAFGCDVKGVGQDGSGSFAGMHTLFNRTATFSVVINRDAQVASAKTNWAAGTPVTIRLGWGNATAGTVDGDLDILVTGKIEKIEEDNEEILGAIITGTIAASAAGSEATTIVIANSQDRTWTA